MTRSELVTSQCVGLFTGSSWTMDLQWSSLSLLGFVVDCRLGRICGRGWPSLYQQERDSVGVDRFVLNEELMPRTRGHALFIFNGRTK